MRGLTPFEVDGDRVGKFTTYLHQPELIAEICTEMGLPFDERVQPRLVDSGARDAPFSERAATVLVWLSSTRRRSSAVSETHGFIRRQRPAASRRAPMRAPSAANVPPRLVERG